MIGTWSSIDGSDIEESQASIEESAKKQKLTKEFQVREYVFCPYLLYFEFKIRKS